MTQRDIFLCFIYTVIHEELLGMLAGLGVDEKDLRVIKNLHLKQKAVVRVGDRLTDTVDIKRGLG